MLKINKHHFCIGWTGRNKQTGTMSSGRVSLMAHDNMHAEQRAREFYAQDYDELEIYGIHLVYDEVA